MTFLLQMECLVYWLKIPITLVYFPRINRFTLRICNLLGCECNKNQGWNCNKTENIHTKNSTLKLSYE